MTRHQHHILDVEKRRAPREVRGSDAGMRPVSRDWRELAGVFALSPPSLPLRQPVATVLQVEWEWLRPLPAILRIGGWSIDDVVSDRRIAEQVRLLWKLRREAETIKAVRERRNEIEEIRWHRRQGCPVPCTVCGSLDPCGCP